MAAVKCAPRTEAPTSVASRAVYSELASRYRSQNFTRLENLPRDGPDVQKIPVVGQFDCGGLLISKSGGASCPCLIVQNECAAT